MKHTVMNGTTDMIYYNIKRVNCFNDIQAAMTSNKMLIIAWPGMDDPEIWLVGPNELTELRRYYREQLDTDPVQLNVLTPS